ncbi:MAG: PilZ domain-containing protein [Bdellovibrio sp.]
MQALPKLLPRLARYTLKPEDNSLVRFAGPQKTPWEEDTEIQNISLSGLSFTAPSDLCPELSEVIKIEFSIPGGQQTACFALVTRLEPMGQTRMLVGVHFHKLNLAQKVILAQALTLKLKDQQLKSVTQGQKKLHALLFLIPLSLLLFSLVLTLWLW